MALSIITNMSSLNSARRLESSTKSMGKTFERLASGMRINGARDDAAGLSIATRMTAQIRGMNQAMRNTNDGISLLQVAEGALVETQNAMQRMRELAVQANTATMTDTDKNALQLEVTALMAEIERISTTTEFNGHSLINGAFAGKKFQIGANVGETLAVTIGSAQAQAIGLSGGGAYMSIGSGAANANLIEGVITRIDTALDSVSDIRANLGALQNRFESLIANVANVAENTVGARSRIMDADIASETANLTKNAIMQQAGTSILAQANQQPQIALQLLG
jgi:flagellin